jgi:hypothetical protein
MSCRRQQRGVIPFYRSAALKLAHPVVSFCRVVSPLYPCT